MIAQRGGDHLPDGADFFEVRQRRTAGVEMLYQRRQIGRVGQQIFGITLQQPSGLCADVGAETQYRRGTGAIKIGGGPSPIGVILALGDGSAIGGDGADRAQLAGEIALVPIVIPHGYGRPENARGGGAGDLDRLPGRARCLRLTQGIMRRRNVPAEKVGGVILNVRTAEYRNLPPAIDCQPEQGVEQLWCNSSCVIRHVFLGVG